MSNESTKSDVLAKCEDLHQSMEGWGIFIIDEVHFYPSVDGYKIKGVHFDLDIDKEIPADDYVWQLAADILKITPTIDEFEADLSRRQYHHDLEVARKEGYDKGKAEASARPSDALLLKCWDTAIQHSRRATTTGSISSDEAFFEWLATLPPDTLKADRDWLAANFTSGTLEKELQRLCYNPEFIGCLKRLAGMEVGNG